MTRALQAAIAKLERLSADEQDRVAAWLRDELPADERWLRRFATSQDTLGKLATETREVLALGRGTKLLLDLRESLDQSRARGIPLAEAERQLAKRVRAEGLDAKGRRATRPRAKGRRPRGGS